MTLQHRSDEETETASTATTDGSEAEQVLESIKAAASDQPATISANRLWDDFDADGDDESEETNEAASTTPTTQSTETQQPTTEESFGDVLETLSSFGQSTSPTQVLVLSPTSHSVTNDIFTQITSTETSQNVVFVSSVQSTSNRLPMVREFPTWVEGKSTLIEVGNPQSGASTRGTNTLDRKVDTYKEVANPQNLAKLGVVISHEINRVDNQYPTVFAFHTLSSIQQYLGTKSIVPFLYTLCSKCNDSGVMGYCHLDPNRHTDDAVGTIKSVFDVTVTITPSGDVEIE